MSGQWFPDAREAVEYLKRRTVDEGGLKGQRQKKFIEDFHLIHDRKKNEPCIPILPGHDQEAWFAKLEVNGIWKIVFEYLTNPSDVTSAHFACELFRKHLEEKRKMMLLPIGKSNMVFGVLRTGGHLKFKGFVHVRDGDAEESREVLNQRLVSKAWKNAAEIEFLARLKQAEPIRKIHCSHWSFVCNPRVECNFSRVRDVDLALESLPKSSSSSCASLLRMMKVYNNGSLNERALYYSKIVEFVDRHGGAVWALHFNQSRNQLSGGFQYEFLRNLLCRMPNLKFLYVFDYYSRKSEAFEYNEVDIERNRAEFDEEKARLRASIIRNPLPNLPVLESFHIYSFPDQNPDVLAEFLSKSVNLKIANFSDANELKENAMPDFVWKELSRLRLEHFHFGTHMPGQVLMRYLRHLREFDWPLKSLVIGFDREYDEDSVNINASIVFSLLTRFKETLEEVTFEGTRNAWVINDQNPVVLDFPNLKIFKMSPIADESHNSLEVNVDGGEDE